jgi:hypothetical protein
MSPNVAKAASISPLVLEDPDLQSHGAGCRFALFGFGDTCTARVGEQGNASGSGHQLPQQFQPLCRQLGREPIDACQVAARPSETGDKTKLDRVFGGEEDDGDRPVAALAASATVSLRPWRSARRTSAGASDDDLGSRSGS